MLSLIVGKYDDVAVVIFTDVCFSDSMIDTFVQVKQEPNVKVKHEAVVNQKPFKTV